MDPATDLTPTVSVGMAKRTVSHSTQSDDDSSSSERSALLPAKKPALYTTDIPAALTKSQDQPGWEAFRHLPWYRRPSIYWLVLPFTLFTLAFGTTLVPKLNLILVLICRDHAATLDPKHPLLVGAGRRLEDLPDVGSPQCRNPEVQALVAHFSLWSTLIAGTLTAFTAPLLGALSDRYGRIRLITLITVGTFASELLTIAAARMPDIVSVYWIMVGYAFDGLCGSFIAVMAINHAYATDITPPMQRNVVFGFFHGCLFSGIAIGPVLGGYITRWTGSLLTVFYFAICAHTFYMLMMIFVVPESLTEERQLAARRQPYRLYAPMEVLWPPKDPKMPFLRRNLVLLSAADTLSFGIAMGAMTVTILYGELLFGWGNLESSRFLTAVNVARVLNLLIGLPLLTRLFRGSAAQRTAAEARKANSDVGHGEPPLPGCDSLDVGIVRFAFLIELVGTIGYATVQTGGLFVGSGMLAALGGIGSPTMQSSLTKHVPADRTGQLLGATGQLHAVARVVAPATFSLIYGATVASAPQTVFVCFAALFLLGNFAVWGIRASSVDQAVRDDGEDHGRDIVREGDPRDMTQGES